MRQGGAHGGFPPLGGTARGVLRLVEFITDGRLGPTGQDVADALEEASEGQPEALALLLSEDPESTACEILARTSVHVDASSLEEVIARADRQVQAMLPDPRTAADARSEAENAVNRLFVRMFGRTGEADPGRRVFTRAELAGILGGAGGPADWRALAAAAARQVPRCCIIAGARAVRGVSGRHAHAEHAPDPARGGHNHPTPARDRSHPGDWTVGARRPHGHGQVDRC